jgi:hypothetical protein
VAVAVVVAVTAGGSSPPPPAPPVAAPVVPTATPAVPATLTVAGVAMLPAGSVSALAGMVGRTAVARGVPVLAVPADEGFWVGTGPGHRIWVQLVAGGGESAVRVRAGQRASFAASVRRVTAGTPARVGLSAAAGAAELTRAGAYLEVDPRRLVLTG